MTRTRSGVTRTRRVPGTLTPGLSNRSLSHDAYRAHDTDLDPIVNVITSITPDDDLIAEREADRLVREWLAS